MFIDVVGNNLPACTVSQNGRQKLNFNRCGNPKCYFGEKYLVSRCARKIAESDYELRNVCPSVRKEHLGFHWMDFYEI